MALMSRDTEPFRGVSAPASLKLDHADERDVRGLAFRGVSAPASLKHRRSPRMIDALATFRGVSAPASLKPAIRSGTAVPGGRFPGR